MKLTRGELLWLLFALLALAWSFVALWASGGG